MCRDCGECARQAMVGLDSTADTSAVVLVARTPQKRCIQLHLSWWVGFAVAAREVLRHFCLNSIRAPSRDAQPIGRLQEGLLSRVLSCPRVAVLRGASCKPESYGEFVFRSGGREEAADRCSQSIRLWHRPWRRARREGAHRCPERSRPQALGSSWHHGAGARKRSGVGEHAVRLASPGRHPPLRRGGRSDARGPRQDDPGAFHRR